MNPRRVVVSILLATALLATLAACEDDTLDSGGPVDPSQPAVVRVVPGNTVVPVGAVIPIDIRIENGFDVDSVTFHLLFNSPAVDFEPPAVEGSYLSAGGISTTFDVLELPAGDELAVTLARDGNATGASGAGTLARFPFRALADGPAVFTFSGASVKDHDGNNRPASFVGGTATIVP